MSFAIALHVLSAVIWVGGMFFAYMAMRPAVVEVVDASRRGLLWSKTLERFFRWVWLAVVLLLVTGYWMIFSVFGGMANAGWHIHAMQTLGLVMMLLYFSRLFCAFPSAQAGGRRKGSTGWRCSGGKDSPAGWYQSDSWPDCGRHRVWRSVPVS